MTIFELTHKAYYAAKDKGFHDKPLQPLESIALMHSELSEAAEELRTTNAPLWYEKDDNGHKKPQGLLSELADTVIRIADFCGANGYDLERAILAKLAYNETRPRLHGKLK